jgi:hypothetical protein
MDKKLKMELDRIRENWERARQVEKLELEETKQLKRKRNALKRRLVPYNAYLIENYVLIREHNYLSMWQYDPDTMELINDLNLFIQLSMF